MNKIAKNLETFSIGIKNHNRANPSHTVLGIGLNIFDIERLDLEIGEEIFPGVCIEEDKGITGAFRIVCDGQHDIDIDISDEVKNEIFQAVGIEI